MQKNLNINLAAKICSSPYQIKHNKRFTFGEIRAWKSFRGKHKKSRFNRLLSVVSVSIFIVRIRRGKPGLSKQSELYFLNTLWVVCFFSGNAVYVEQRMEIAPDINNFRSFKIAFPDCKKIFICNLMSLW